MGLTHEEQCVAEEFEAILRSPDVDSAYVQLPETMSGKILNADFARELSPHYKTVSDRVQFTKATYPPARDYVYERFMRTIQRPHKGNLAIILAGGAASGKSTSVKTALNRDDVSLVFDSNCADYDKACRMIDALSNARWAALVVYVHRNYRSAVEAMLLRAAENGRYVPISEKVNPNLARLHMLAQRTYIDLIKRYDSRPLIDFIALRNPWTPDNPLSTSTIADKTLAVGGKRYYTSIEDLYAIQSPIIQTFMAAGKLSKELCGALGIA